MYAQTFLFSTVYVAVQQPPQPTYAVAPVYDPNAPMVYPPAKQFQQ